MAEDTWYSKLREQWQPDRVRLLLIGESAPDSAGGERRFFYAPKLTSADNLFRGVVAALYGPIPRGMAGAPKAPWLTRLYNDEVFLIDLVPYPVNNLSPDKAEARRMRVAAHRKHAPECVEWARSLSPEGIIVCHDPSYRALAPGLRAARLPLLHDEPIPFPLGNMREPFVAGVRAVLSDLPGGWTPRAIDGGDRQTCRS